MDHLMLCRSLCLTTPNPRASSPQGVAVAQKIGAKQYLECSARTGEGVREVFQYATRYALLANKKPKKSLNNCVVV